MTTGLVFGARLAPGSLSGCGSVGRLGGLEARFPRITMSKRFPRKAQCHIFRLRARCPPWTSCQTSLPPSQVRATPVIRLRLSLPRSEEAFRRPRSGRLRSYGCGFRARTPLFLRLLCGSKLPRNDQIAGIDHHAALNDPQKRTAT
jgi:hypothetical protein